MICALGPRRKHGGQFKIHTRPARATAAGRWSANTATGPVEVGTVSFGGALCGLPGAPTVYSRVSSSLDFITTPKLGHRPAGRPPRCSRVPRKQPTVYGNS